MKETFKIGGKISKKVYIYRSFINRPNIYTSLFFKDIIFEYIISNNLVTFAGKDKYRFKLYLRIYILLITNLRARRFKADILYINYRDITKVLMAKEIIY